MINLQTGQNSKHLRQTNEPFSKQQNFTLVQTESICRQQNEINN